MISVVVLFGTSTSVVAAGEDCAMSPSDWFSVVAPLVAVFLFAFGLRWLRGGRASRRVSVSDLEEAGKIYAQIWAQLTPAEHARLTADSRRQHWELGLGMGGPIVVMTVLLVWSPQVGLLFLLPCSLYFVFVAVPRLRAMSRNNLELLCDTEWARSQGYRPDSFELTPFHWPR